MTWVAPADLWFQSTFAGVGLHDFTSSTGLSHRANGDYKTSHTQKRGSYLLQTLRDQLTWHKDTDLRSLRLSGGT